jgi:MAC/Perforin domain
MATTILNTLTGGQEEALQGADTGTAQKLSNFGQLGFGINVIEIRPTVPLVDFTYTKGESNIFHFRKQAILIPDQLTWDPTPSGQMHEGNFSGIMTTAREYQRTLSARFLGGAPVDGIEFSGEANVANERFTRSSQTTVRMMVEKLASFQFLNILNIDFRNALTNEVRRAITEAGTNEQAIQSFFSLYGTHVVTKAAIGGHMHLETRLQITSDVNEEVTKNSIDLSGEAESEQAAYIKGTIGFHDRDENRNKVFIKNSSADFQLLGGDVTAKDVEAWKESLRKAEIPTAGAVAAMHRVSRHGSAGYLRGDGSQYLGLVNPKLTPIYKVLGLTPEQQAAWEKAYKAYVGNVSPFDNNPQRFTVDHLGSALRKADDEAVFEMGGWHETWEDTVAFEALPMATARVAVRTNSIGDVWTEKTIYAGQSTQVRGKTPYWGNRYSIKLLSINGDPGGVVYARARKVPW